MGASACQKSLAEFAARRRQRNKIIFSRDMCVRENTARAASVEFVRHRRTNYARSRPQAFCRKNPEGFSTVSSPHSLLPGNGGLAVVGDLQGRTAPGAGASLRVVKCRMGAIMRPAKIAVAARLPRPVAGPPPPGPGPGVSETGPSNPQRNCRRRCQKNG